MYIFTKLYRVSMVKSRKIQQKLLEILPCCGGLSFSLEYKEGRTGE